ncbi:MAG: murein biosynthesis integral membrane protein MurJ [Candidatus Poribacteria bacterium]
MDKSLNKAESHSLVRSAGIISIAVIISRMLGLVRESVLAYLFPAKTSLDAFYAAFRIPNLLRDLFAENVLSNAFVATFVDAETKSGEETAWRLANLIFNTITVILLIITTLGIIFTPFIVDLVFMGKGFDVPFSPESSYGFSDKRELTIYLTRIMFPFLILVSFSAIAMGLLNSKRRFAIPALAPSFFNIGSITVGVVGYYIAPKFGLHPTTGMAIGVLVGGLLQFLAQVPTMSRVGFRYKPILSFSDPYLKQVLKLVAPAIIGTAAVEINVLVNSFFASQGEGWVSWLTQAFRIMYFPIGALGVAISTAALPTLSSYASQNYMDKYKSTLSHALKLMFILALPASAGLMALNKPIVALIFERGRFSDYDTTQVASALFCYAFGLCGYSGVKIATNGFYALKNVRTPAIISVSSIGVNVIFNYILIFKLNLDHRSLALSTSFYTTVNFVLVLWLLSRKVGGFGFSGIASVFLKAIIASACMGIISSWTYGLFDGILGSVISLALAMICALLTLYFLYRLLRVNEFNQIVNSITRKVKRQKIGKNNPPSSL